VKRNGADTSILTPITRGSKFDASTPRQRINFGCKSTAVEEVLVVGGRGNSVTRKITGEFRREIFILVDLGQVEIS